MVVIPDVHCQVKSVMHHDQIRSQKPEGLFQVLLVDHGEFKSCTAPLGYIVDDNALPAFNTDPVNIGAAPSRQVDKNVFRVIERTYILSDPVSCPEGIRYNRI